MSANISDNIERFKVPELKSFLKARGVKCSGTKSELLRLARLYCNHPAVKNTENETTINESCAPSDYQVDTWKNATEKILLPSRFTIATITEYLSVISSSLEFQEDEEENEVVDVGTQKPIVKGRQMYQSSKLTLAEFGKSGSNTVFRGNCEASLRKNTCRYPQVVISGEGQIVASTCTCPVAADGRCCHIACLLYLIEDLSYGNIPKLHLPSTSTLQYWGQGRKIGNDPKPIQTQQYSKKRKVDRYHEFDPRQNSTNDPTSMADNFLQRLQSIGTFSMWEKILMYSYQDYELSADRQTILKSLCQQYEQHLMDGLKEHLTDPLTNAYGVHVHGTEEQAASELWQQLRKCRITASRFKSIVKNPRDVAKTLWQCEADLQTLKSIRWGKSHENEARETYESVAKKCVQEVGLFISRSQPIFGASPDGLIDNGKGVLEIKCPFSLRESDLKDIKDGHFFVVKNGKMLLRKSHSYYYQVQLQMYVTGAEYADFFI